MKKRKTILFVMNSAQRTGASIYAEKIIKYLVEHNKEYRIAVLFAQEGELQDRFRNLDVTLLNAGQKSPLNAGIIRKILYRLSYYFCFARVMATLRPNMLYSNTITNNGEVVIAKLFKAKTIVHSHEGKNMAYRMRYKVKLSSMFTDRYIGVSNYAAEVITALVNKPCTVIHNGIDDLEYSNQITPCNRVKTLGIIGTVDRNKGQLLLIKALDILVNEKNIDLAIKIVGSVNDCKYAEEIRNYCAVRGLENRVTFTGPLVGAAKIYSEIDCVVSASFDEAMPLVSLESMVLGIMLIASDTGGNKELVEDGVTGLLFPIGDYKALAERIYEIYSDTVLYGKITAEAKIVVGKRYNLSDKLREISNQIQEVTS